MANKTNAESFDVDFAEVSDLLATLASQQNLVFGVEGIQAWWKAADAFEDRYSSLRSFVLRHSMPSRYGEMLYALEERSKLLLHMPLIELVLWMQNMMRFPNLLIVEIDVHHSGRDETVDVIRIVAMDSAGNAVFDRCLRLGTGRAIISQQTSYLTGLTDEDLRDTPTLAQVWPQLLDVLAGKHAVAFDLERAQMHLSIAARRYQLTVPVLVGRSMRRLCQMYFAPYHLINRCVVPPLGRAEGLAALCQRIGFPLPDHPFQTARDRASGLLLLLQAMSEGFPCNRIAPKEQ